MPQERPTHSTRRVDPRAVGEALTGASAIERPRPRRRPAASDCARDLRRLLGGGRRPCRSAGRWLGIVPYTLDRYVAGQMTYFHRLNHHKILTKSGEGPDAVGFRRQTCSGFGQVTTATWPLFMERQGGSPRLQPWEDVEHVPVRTDRSAPSHIPRDRQLSVEHRPAPLSRTDDEINTDTQPQGLKNLSTYKATAVEPRYCGGSYTSVSVGLRCGIRSSSGSTSPSTSSA